MFWILMFGSFALLSVMTVNPIPLVLAVVVWLIAQPFERPLRNEIMAAGGNPELPPAPTSAVGCAGFIVWLVVMGLATLTFIGLAILAMEGRF